MNMHFNPVFFTDPCKIYKTTRKRPVLKPLKIVLAQSKSDPVPRSSIIDSYDDTAKRTLKLSISLDDATVMMMMKVRNFLQLNIFIGYEI